MTSNMLFRKFLLVILFCGGSLYLLPAYSARIVINEFLASNQNGLRDADGDKSDWIELYNPGSEACSLSGYTLTDDPGKPQKWTFPELEIAPCGYLIVWASDKNTVYGEEPHTNFKLSKDGEFLGLYDSSGNPVDTLTFGTQSEDVSFGRWPNGTGEFTSFSSPTPGAENQKACALSIDPPGGMYTGSVSITLASDFPEGDIRYTTDGSIPTNESLLYSNPLTIGQTTVLNAAVFYGGQRITENESEIYFIHEDVHLPVLALIIDRDDLWDEKNGIYTNPFETGDDWEKPVKAVLIEDNEVRFSVPAGLRIHGQTSRTHPKKNFRLYFRNEYGMSRLEYPLFPGEDIQSFKRLVIHNNLISNPFTHSLWDELGGLTSAFKPVALYLNGDYWGIYYIRERIDKYYVEDHLAFDDMDMIDTEWLDVNLDISEGDRIFWDETLTFFNKNHLYSDNLYNTAITQYINRDNFTDYHIINIFAGNQDWPQKNNLRIRDRQGDPRWLYVMWDADATWGSDATLPTLEWATRSDIRTDIRAEDNTGLLWSTLFIRRLLENESYKIYFINRFCDLLNTCLSYGNLQILLSDLSNAIVGETNRDWDRWYDSYYVNSPFMRTFDRFVQFYNEYCWNRPGEMRKQIASLFSLNGSYALTLDPPEGEGSVRLNSINIDSFPWSGIYFKEVPVTLKAMPDNGWKFVGWNDSAFSESDSITVSFKQGVSIYPIFKQGLLLDTLYVSAITDTSAKIYCRTNLTASCRLIYGTNIANLSDTLESATESETHEFEITGLASHQEYQFYTESVIAGFDTLRSPVASFETKKSPLAWVTCHINSVEYNRARFSWATSDSTRGAVIFYDENQNMRTISDTLWAEDHSLWIEDLADSTQYQALIIAENRLGEHIESDTLSFLTNADPIPPVILTQEIILITDSSAILTWSTDEPVHAAVEFGLTQELGRQTEWHENYLTSDQSSLHPLNKNTLCYYRLLVTDKRGNKTVSPVDTFRTTGQNTSVTNLNTGVPASFCLKPLYPNPFNPETVLRYDLPQTQHVILSIFNIHGQCIQTVDFGQAEAGYHEYKWNAEYHPAGTYIFQLQAGKWQATQKCVLLK